MIRYKIFELLRKNKSMFWLNKKEEHLVDNHKMKQKIKNKGTINRAFLIFNII
jgi:hypothetical protein